MLRTHTCGQLTAQHVDQEVTLCGWVNKKRNLGGMTFIDLRDRYGMTQVTVDPDKASDILLKIAQSLKSEYVVKMTGKVVQRPNNMINKEMITGEVEVYPTQIEILSKAEELPFSIDHENPVGEDIRLTHRYLDLRRQTLKNNIEMRHKIYVETMKFFEANDFLFIETPMMIKNTPEGAREFIVPSRLEHGNGFVLPQSPQQLKQILMVSGVDKYVQFAKCFRDEDPRGDRQPEFTQVDLEMSFVEQADVLDILQNYFTAIVQKLYPHRPIKINPFPQMTRHDAMNLYGSDKPELRTTELSFIDVTDRAKETDFGVFNSAACVKAIVAPKEYSRSEIDRDLTPLLQQHGAKGLAYIIISENKEIKSPIAKFFSDAQIDTLIAQTNAQPGETIFFQATERLECVELLGVLRNKLIQDLGMLDDKEDELAFANIVDFPMFEMDDEGNLASMHHPFTKPKDEHIPFIKELGKKINAENYEPTKADIDQLLTINADAYDIVLNGYEIGGGSIRINDAELQSAIFAILGLTSAQTEERFGHMLKAFSFGVPPHGGFAVGFDRMVMVLQNMPNIREVIAFPKNQKWQDLMLNAPGRIEPEQWDELGLDVIEKEE